ncbi:DUF6221 family protein [Streptomyces decoyicus]
MTDDLVAFLRARYDEDAEAAKDAAKRAAAELATADRKADRFLPPYDGSHWSNDYDHVHVHDHRPERSRRRVQIADCGHGAIALTSHIARHDPERVLAEVEAKRAIVDQYAEVAENDGANAYEYDRGWVNALRESARLLALPYAAHPDYRDEWRP